MAQPFWAAVVANAVDGFTSDLVVRGQNPRRLTDAAFAALGLWVQRGAWAYVALAILAQILPARGRFWLILAVNGAGALWLLLFAYLGFAAGLAITLRAAILAYLLAVVLGLGWIGLLNLVPRKRTLPLFGVLIALCFGLCAQNLFAPQQSYALYGTLSGKIAVIPGTPQALIDAARDGAFPAGGGIEREAKTFKDAPTALAALSPAISAALLPDGQGTGPVIWQVQTLSDGHKTAAVAFGVLGLVLALLTLGGAIHRRHPMSVAAEFLVDTLRGIPMLVIVLYIGLPLAGAVKAGTGGFIDPPNMMRGIFAMALAYSAYLAEIFRAGIAAVPEGQMEAARSLGLTRWQTARHVVIPQAFKIVIPPLGNEFIAILKDTSLLSILSIRDVTQRMREFQSASFLPFAPYNSAAIFYLLLTLVAASLIAAIERKFHVKR
jgi:polar amino acid transport system permease protein